MCVETLISMYWRGRVFRVCDLLSAWSIIEWPHASAGKQLLALALLVVEKHYAMTGGHVGKSAYIWCWHVKFHL